MSDEGGVQAELGSTPPPPPPPPTPTGIPATSTNGFAVAALVLGIVATVFFWTILGGFLLGILAIIFGVMGLSQVKSGAPSKGMATAGVVLGIVSMVASLAFVVVLIGSAAHDAGHKAHSFTFCFDHPDDPSC